MKSSPRVCISEILISYSGNGRYSASDCRYPHAAQIPGTEALGEGATFENNSVIYSHFSLILHCLALCYYLYLCAVRPKHTLDGRPGLGMS